MPQNNYYKNSTVSILLNELIKFKLLRQIYGEQNYNHYGFP
ncbi:hypothetical protein M2326_000232 [Flavobacterium sp. 7A]|nr:hypothetical protein [Flavobacterium sp. 7A]